MEEQTVKQEVNYIKIITIIIAAVIILALSIFVAYIYSQSKQGGIVLPGGITYLGASPTPIVATLTPGPTTPPLKFTADSTVPYKDHYGITFPYSFSYPETLPIVIFPSDPYDSVAISWGNIPPQVNILINIEKIKDRDESFLNKSKKDFVEAWWKYFSGLKGVAAVTPFTNVKGMKGYKAQYINSVNQTPNIDVFFEVPQRPDIMIHLANGILDQTIFDRIVDSVSWNVPTPTPT